MAIDVTPLLSAVGRTGIGVLTAEMVERVAPKVEVVAYAKTGHPKALARAPLPAGVEKARSWQVMPARPLGLLWSHVDWPRAEFWVPGVDVVHGTNMVVPPTRRAGRVVTVHDLAPVRFPQGVGHAHLRDPHLVRRAIRSGVLVHTYSEYVRQEVMEVCGAAPDEVVTIAPGPPPMPTACAEDGHRLLGFDRYVLALGTLQPRKNLPWLVAAFDKLAKNDPKLHLVLAGAANHQSESVFSAVRNAEHGDRIRCDGRWVDDDEKEALLCGASVLVYPSTYEGFGLPILEAMQAGVPVITTTAGALLEVSGARRCWSHQKQAMAFLMRSTGCFKTTPTATTSSPPVGRGSRASPGRISSPA